jgi:hypothetical protein
MELLRNSKVRFERFFFGGRSLGLCGPVRVTRGFLPASSDVLGSGLRPELAQASCQPSQHRQQATASGGARPEPRPDPGIGLAWRFGKALAPQSQACTALALHSLFSVCVQLLTFARWTTGQKGTKVDQETGRLWVSIRDWICTDRMG